MRDGDRQSRLIGQGLQFGFPQPHPHPVAAAAIGRDQQPLGLGIAGLAELMPPAPDTFDGKGGGVAGDPEINPARVGGDVVDAIGRHLAQLRQDEIMHPDRLGLAFGAQLAASVLEVTNQLLLLGVDRNSRLAGGLERLHLGVDILELRVAIGVVRALTGLAVGLQAEPQTPQQPSDQLLACAETALGQRTGQITLAPADPQQRRLGVTANGRLHQLSQRIEQPRFSLGLGPATTARATGAAGELVLAVSQLLKSATDRAAGDARHRRYRHDATAPGHIGLTGSPQPPVAFPKKRCERFETRFDGEGVNHALRLVQPANRFLPTIAIRLFQLRP